MQTPSLHFLWKAGIITTYLRGNCETDKLAEYSDNIFCEKPFHAMEARP